MNGFNRKPAHAVPNWQAPASPPAPGGGQAAIEESQVEGGRGAGAARKRGATAICMRTPISFGLCDWRRVWFFSAKAIGDSQPRKRNGFFVITFPPGTIYGGSCGIALNSTTRRHPRLGLVAGSRGPTQIHIRASATGPVSRRATSAPSHRADEPPGPQAPGKQARLVRTGSEGFPRRTT